MTAFSGDYSFHLLGALALLALQVNRCSDVIILVPCNYMQVCILCAWIQRAIDLLVRPTRSSATIYVVSGEVFRSTRFP